MSNESDGLVNARVYDKITPDKSKLSRKEVLAKIDALRAECTKNNVHFLGIAMVHLDDTDKEGNAIIVSSMNCCFEQMIWLFQRMVANEVNVEDLGSKQ